MRHYSRRTSRTSTVLLLAAGAVAGLALGALLADRMGGLDGLLDRARGDDKRAARRRRRTAPGLSDEGEGEESEPAGETRTRVAMEAAASPAATMPAPAAAKRSSPDEATLEARVLEAFHNDPILSERAIDIGAIGTGVIELTGWVHSRSEIGHAVTLARGVPDVSTVVDRLAVRDAAVRRSPRDAAVATELTALDSTQPPRAD